MKTSKKYIDLWIAKRKEIKNRLKTASGKKLIQLNSDDFRKVGNRKKYSFNLEFRDGIVSNNIGGSAVARDLAAVLINSLEIKNILKSGHFKIRMDKEFILWIEKL